MEPKAYCLCGHELEEHFGEIAWLHEKIGMDDEFGGGKALACWIGSHIHICQFMRCKCQDFRLDNLKYVKEIQRIKNEDYPKS